ncbi:hypothetical protein ZHAS_00009749 [Anopheles sinensis]|uniref:Uncharacterized protein n=1 Tax=Anopheles sinensis TaxID=74873 RepID=A0A084VVU6_ANOSI|nr:hypothetical protein ZHAS_00009749 [Anopheles sinensis]
MGLNRVSPISGPTVGRIGQRSVSSLLRPKKHGQPVSHSTDDKNVVHAACSTGRQQQHPFCNGPIAQPAGRLGRVLLLCDRGGKFVRRKQSFRCARNRTDS